VVEIRWQETKARVPLVSLGGIDQCAGLLLVLRLGFASGSQSMGESLFSLKKRRRPETNTGQDRHQ
jgi:hypothetical protein